MTTRKLLAMLAALLLVCCGAGCSTCSVAQGPPVTMPKRDAAADVGEPTPDEYGPGGYRQVRSVAVVLEVRRCDEDPPNDDRHWPHRFLTGRQSDDAPWKVIGFGAG
ncbi:hypothetical protein ACWCSD_39300 [Nonomuraea sp. NPDC001684]